MPSNMPAQTAIRTIFLHPERTYSLNDAASLLAMDVDEIQGWIDVGEIEPDEGTDGLHLPWSEVVALAMERWDQQTIEAALGDDVRNALPELRRLADLHVRVPQFEVVALTHLAARDGVTVDAIVDRQLLDLVGTQSHWLAAVIPGFTEAADWPDA
jgi:hypothetical protein